MVFNPDLDIAPSAEPVFVEALAAAVGSTPEAAEQNFKDVSEMTDLHRVETFLELAAPGGSD